MGYIDNGSVARTNVETNPDFEADITGWLAAGTPLRRERTTAVAHDGVASCELETDAALEGTIQGTSKAAAPNKTWAAVAYFRGPEGAEFEITLEERNAEDAVVATSVGAAVETDGSGWFQALVTRAFGASGTQLRTRLRTRTASTIVWQVDSVLIEQTADPGFVFPTAAHLASGEAVENEDGTYTLAPFRRSGFGSHGSSIVNPP